MMNLAFCLFNYFPYGGLQRDFYRIAEQCAAKGHKIDVYTMAWEGGKPHWATVHTIPKKGKTNHERALNFSKELKKIIDVTHPDKVIGFNKIPHLDIYYAADGCFVTKPQYHRNFFKRLTSRYRVFKKLEEAVFSPKLTTEILLISEKEKHNYQQIYHTPAPRLHLLPPGISKACIPPPNVNEIRENMRNSLGISANEFMLLCIASHFHTKGIDRALKAAASLPNELKNRCHLVIVGQDNIQAYACLLKPIASHVHCLGARNDVPDLLFAADLLVHYARVENTGTVIVEAMVAGLPVITTACCGYARYVIEAVAGLVIPEKFSQKEANTALEDALLNSEKRQQWRSNALNYSQHADLFSLIDRAVAVIEKIST